MAAFRIVLVVLFLILFGDTAVVVSNHGWGLLAACFGGALFLTVCLFAVSLQVRGDVRQLLLGMSRARGS